VNQSQTESDKEVKSGVNKRLKTESDKGVKLCVKLRLKLSLDKEELCV
jgi:hypothetical protein